MSLRVVAGGEKFLQAGRRRRISNDELNGLGAVGTRCGGVVLPSGGSAELQAPPGWKYAIEVGRCE